MQGLKIGQKIGPQVDQDSGESPQLYQNTNVEENYTIKVKHLTPHTHTITYISLENKPNWV